MESAVCGAWAVTAKHPSAVAVLSVKVLVVYIVLSPIDHCHPPAGYRLAQSRFGFAVAFAFASGVRG